MFRSVLVANRGEIACRIIHSLNDLGVGAVAVHSEADATARHVRVADRSVEIGAAPPQSSYLNVDAIIGAARSGGADAVHPGYGFLSESPVLARAVHGAGLGWIGPPPRVLDMAGDKMACRAAFGESGFPVLPSAGPFTSPEDGIAGAGEVGFPVMVKAVMGGGGIGMGVAGDPDTLRGAVETAATRAERFFGDPAVYLERYVPGARHVEVQVLADDQRTIPLHERECSVQRRHQKVIEESPSPAVDPGLRERLCAAAVASMEAIGYRGAGTVECILTPQGEFYFLEVNARIQVEHPVTEMITGMDLVAEQVRIAAGEGMSTAGPPPAEGHALECRVYAEDPTRFLPSPGRIDRLRLPEEARCDFGYDEGDEVPMFYDPLIGKVIVAAATREEAVQAMCDALGALEVEGVKTNVPALLRVLEDEGFRSGRYDTTILGQ